MSGDSRAEILRRVRQALAVTSDGGAPGEERPERGYLTVHAERTADERVDLLAENLTDYRAAVHRTDAAGLPATVARLLAEHGSRSVVLPGRAPRAWVSEAAGVEVLDDGDPLPAARLDEVDSVVTGCALAVAETGTIVLDAGPDQGRRLLTLIPDHHVCIVRVAEQVVDSVPQALPRLDPARPLTWISGPSATSDIELSRVEGVHGPRTLDVVLVAP